MARQKKGSPIKSSISSRKRKDGKLRYETSIPILVAEQEGVWIITITNGIMTWIPKDDSCCILSPYHNIKRVSND